MSGRASRNRDEQGSALVVAVFVLFLLTGMGITSLFLAQVEVEMSQADSRSKKVFYLAEGGLEDGRETLRLNNKTSTDTNSLDDELVNVAGPDGQIDFDPDQLRPVFDSNGNVTGFTGYGDDLPLRPMTSIADGVYAAFLTNDPVDGEASLTDNFVRNTQCIRFVLDVSDNFVGERRVGQIVG